MLGNLADKIKGLVTEAVTAIQIKVQISQLRDHAKDLRELAGSFENRTCNVSFEKSKGGTVEELQTLAKDLQDMGLVLSALASATARRVDAAADTFVQMDATNSTMFRGGAGK